jgi:hypothetical protein
MILPLTCCHPYSQMGKGKKYWKKKNKEKLEYQRKTGMGQPPVTVIHANGSCKTMPARVFKKSNTHTNH